MTGRGFANFRRQMNNKENSWQWISRNIWALGPEIVK